jgi:predicted ATP-grasp superfamily ATP-dependent carboligase
MRILIHEWSCSGGLDDRSDGGRRSADEGLFAEGAAMLVALVRDACRDPRFEVTALLDATRPMRLPERARVVRVPAGGEIEALVAESARADATFVVAPETAGLLAERIAAARAAGGDVVAPEAGFIAVAADKQATILALAAAGVPVPAGRLLPAGVAWPDRFVRPAVRKPLDGVGGDAVLRVGGADPPPAAVPQATRIEAFVPGEPVGVGCLCGAGRIRPLVPLRQCFDVAGRYVGGEPLGDAATAARAAALAARAVAAVARASAGQPRGWVGVDMILGAAADGRDDRVLEVNPRLTTSFVGHAAGAASSLVAKLLDAAVGRDVLVDSQPRSFRLATDARFSRCD